MRVAQGWSQEDLAETSGLNVRTIQRIEAGRSPSLESLKALGAAFNVNFHDLKEITMNYNKDDATELAILLQQANQDVRTGLRRHIWTFALVNLGLIALNLLVQPKALWFPFPLVFWGIGLFFHWNRVARRRAEGTL